EHESGAARGARVSIMVTIGTGVGTGIVVDGHVVRGAFGGAGEVGHVPVGSDGPPCGCGVEGGAEARARGPRPPARAPRGGARRGSRWTAHATCSSRATRARNW